MALARAHTSLAHCRAAALWPSPGWHCATRWLASSPPVSPLAALPPRERLARLREGGAEIEPPPFLSPTAPAPPPRTSCIDSEAELENLARAGAAAVSASGPDLLDSFGRRHNYLRVSLTERCNFRCTYCMPAEGVELLPQERLMQPAELTRLTALLVGLGVTKVRLTGGEPLVRRDAVDVVDSIHRACSPLGLKTLAMTTNGLLLPRRLPALQAAGLNAVNISLDTLQPDTFRRLTRRDGLHVVLRAIRAAAAAGLAAPVKVNAVVMGGVNCSEVESLAALARELPIHVRFIEFMPFTGNGWSDASVVTSADTLRKLKAAFPDLQPVGSTPHSGDGHSTAELYSAPHWPGAVGFISTISSKFCATCSRLRLTADGALNTCLFGQSEVSLLTALRNGASDTDLRHIVRGALLQKAQALGGHANPAELAAANSASGRPMVLIGG